LNSGLGVQFFLEAGQESLSLDPFPFRAGNADPSRAAEGYGAGPWAGVLGRRTKFLKSYLQSQVGKVGRKSVASSVLPTVLKSSTYRLKVPAMYPLKVKRDTQGKEGS
jgi:hypothetical protein